MLLWILLGLIGLVVLFFIVGAVVLYRNGGEWEDAIGAAALTATVGTAMVFMICGMFGSTGNDVTEVRDKQELIALTNDKTKNGGYFFLGTGETDSTPVYRYLAKAPDGAISLTEKKIRDSVLYEVADGKPFMQTRYTGSKANFFWPWDNITESRTVEFHIPEGSITSTFSVSVNN